MPSGDAPRDGRRPTIRDVAVAAGVSKSLVSLVYAAPEAVSDVRRKRVLAAAATLGFRPNQAARSLAAAHGGLIGILLADLRNPVIADLAEAAQREFQRRDIVALVTTAGHHDRDGAAAGMRHGVELFGDLRPSGLLVIGSVPDLAEIERIAHGRPIVLAGAVADEPTAVRTVRGDDQRGVEMLVRHLAAAGHTRIVHAGGAGGAVARLRMDAYIAAMHAVGLTDEIRVVPSDFSREGGRAAAAGLLQAPDPPTAVVAVNDLAAVGVLEEARRAGWTGAVTGYDGTFVAELEQIDLTTIDPDNAEIGRRAATELLDGEGPGEVLITPTLVVRGSTRQ